MHGNSTTDDQQRAICGAIVDLLLANETHELEEKEVKGLAR